MARPRTLPGLLKLWEAVAAKYEALAAAGKGFTKREWLARAAEVRMCIEGAAATRKKK